jgi:hypothetical protein
MERKNEDTEQAGIMKWREGRRKKIEAVIRSDHSLFDHNREMMKQA